MKSIFTILLIFLTLFNQKKGVSEIFTSVEDKFANIEANKRFALKQKNYLFVCNLFKDDSLKISRYLDEINNGLQRMVLVNLSLQELEVISFVDTFQVVLRAKISSGRGKKWTPRGTFTVLKKKFSRPSHKYGGVMTYWNCLSADESMGIHGLRNKSYQQNLGRPVSHGCIRIGKDTEEIFYKLTPIGTQVLIE